MYQENPEKDFFDEVMDLIGADSKDSASAAVRSVSRVDFCCFFSMITRCIRAPLPLQTSELQVQ